MKPTSAAAFLICLGPVSVSICSAQETPTTPPPPAAVEKISLNNRIFLGTSDVYDPTYGLLRVGYVENKVLTFLPLNKQIRKSEMPTPQSRNFTVYNYHSKEGFEGKVDIPIIGSASAAKDQVVFANMEDISEVFAAPEDVALSTCEIWALIVPSQIPKGATILFTDHATFSKVSSGAADKQAAEAKASIGTFFSVGASAYKQASSETKVPLISVTGVQFIVDDPTTFCTGPTPAVVAKKEFKSILDLGGTTELKTKMEF